MLRKILRNENGDQGSRAKAFSDLLKLKDSHNKVKNINSKILEMQKYLKTKFLSNHEVKFAFHTRSKMLDVKRNHSKSYSDLSCLPAGKMKKMTQPYDIISLVGSHTLWLVTVFFAREPQFVAP